MTVLRFVVCESGLHIGVMQCAIKLRIRERFVFAVDYHMDIVDVRIRSGFSGRQFAFWNAPLERKKSTALPISGIVIARTPPDRDMSADNIAFEQDNSVRLPTAETGT